MLISFTPAACTKIPKGQLFSVELSSLMAMFTVNPPDGEAVEILTEDEEASTLLADALQKMDGLIGDFR